MIHNRYVLFVFRLVLGGMFIWAGLLKILDPLDFAQSIANYRAFPDGISLFLALVLPWVEIISGSLLVLGLFRRSASLILCLLLVSFLVLISATVIRGMDIDCGCFGGFSQKVDYKLILTDGALLFLALIVFLSPKPHSLLRKRKSPSL
ncbi:MAG: MauE/DoxX family redox-associated membrane protein [Candidatus Aminicenantes bacterium]